MSDLDAVTIQRPPRLSVKFVHQQSAPLPYAAGPELVDALRGFLPGFDDFLDAFPGVEVVPMVPGLTPALAQKILSKAQQNDPDFKDPHPMSWYRFRVPVQHAIEHVRDAVASWSGQVEHASIDWRPSVASGTVTRGDEGPHADRQLYLGAAPVGVDSEYGWELAGGDGTGVKVAVIDEDWYLTHPDLPEDLSAFLHVDDADSIDGLGLDSTALGPGGTEGRQHGTRSLGIVAGRDDGCGIVGMAPRVEEVGLATIWRNCSGEGCTEWAITSSYSKKIEDDIESALTAAELFLDAGDVLLIEREHVFEDGTKGPIEVRLSVATHIDTLTKMGVTVVASAGNDTEKLTDLPLLSEHVDPSTSDSGSVLVGAVVPAVSETTDGGLEDAKSKPQWNKSSNHGARVDCCAWGSLVHTTDFHVDKYPDYADFANTSAASAIVAGLVVQLQGIVKACTGGTPLEPSQVRDLLRDTTLGTKPLSATSDDGDAVDVGNMPDLRDMVAHLPTSVACTFSADIYGRDFLADDGSAHFQPTSKSPDIIVRPQVVEDPQASYGEGSGTKDRDDLGWLPFSGLTQTVYVRVRNRGNRDAGPARVRLFWVPPSLIVLPVDLRPIGGVVLPSVPEGDELTVFPGIVWHASQQPFWGDATLVAIVHTAGDPEPPFWGFATFLHFLDFVRQHNNVFRRSVFIMYFIPLPFPFPTTWKLVDIRGAFDEPRDFSIDFEFDDPLPLGSELELRLPAQLAEALGYTVTPSHFEEQALVRLRAEDGPRWVLGPVRLERGASHSMGLRLRLPTGFDEDRELTVRQLFEGEEVGRVTYRYLVSRLRRLEGPTHVLPLPP